MQQQEPTQAISQTAHIAPAGRRVMPRRHARARCRSLATSASPGQPGSALSHLNDCHQSHNAELSYPEGFSLRHDEQDQRSGHETVCRALSNIETEQDRVAVGSIFCYVACRAAAERLR